jgi:hypothetical protein
VGLNVDAGFLGAGVLATLNPSLVLTLVPLVSQRMTPGINIAPPIPAITRPRAFARVSASGSLIVGVEPTAATMTPVAPTIPPMTVSTPPHPAIERRPSRRVVAAHAHRRGARAVAAVDRELDRADLGLGRDRGQGPAAALETVPLAGADVVLPAHAVAMARALDLGRAVTLRLEVVAGVRADVVALVHLARADLRLVFGTRDEDRREEGDPDGAAQGGASSARARHDRSVDVHAM